MKKELYRIIEFTLSSTKKPNIIEILDNAELLGCISSNYDPILLFKVSCNTTKSKIIKRYFDVVRSDNSFGEGKYIGSVVNYDKFSISHIIEIDLC